MIPLVHGAGEGSVTVAALARLAAPSRPVNVPEWTEPGLLWRWTSTTIYSMGVDVRPDAGALLKLLGEPLRWEIVRRLAEEDLCTCHLAADLGAAQPLLSHHLRTLRQAGVLRTDRVGAFTYYLLNRDVLAGLAGVLGELAAQPALVRRRPCS
jgi:ArsR family transcriptional regulator, arsenate/arsenite/antimonite-responsive transcriptional repressor